ncbi:MAG: glycosyltransferase [Gemmatimonadetes bacterium]|nr:glycosyltransferase [Gemmatimonadota bacterium]
MRIALVHSRYARAGGEDKAVELQRQLLMERGHSVSLLMGDGARVREGGLRAKLTGALAMGYSWSAGQAMAALIGRERPDLIHVHNLYPTLSPSVVVVAKRAGKPVVMTLHNYRLRCPNGLFLRQGEPCERCAAGNHLHAVVGRCRGSLAESSVYAVTLAWHRWLGLLEKRVDVFISPSRFLAGRLCQYGIPRDRMRVVANFVPDPGARSGGGGYAAYLGRLSPEKGVETLIAAFRRLPDRQLVLAGTGPEEERLRALANAAANIRFVGHLTGQALVDHMRGAAFCIQPSLWYENQPFSALEALAHGVPLLVSDRGGLPELVVPGVSGLVFEAGDVADLCEKAEAMFGADLAQMSGAARRTYLERYTPAVHYRLLAAIYSELTQKEMAG